MAELSTILFLPGAGGSAHFWTPVAERLALPCMQLSWPGLGLEPHDPKLRSLEDHVTRVLEHATEPLDVVAQSMGGRIAIEVASRVPIRRLVLTATSAGVPMHGAEDWRAAYRAKFPRAQAWITEPQPDLSARIATLDIPTLLLWGDRDPISPVAVGERLRELLPNAWLHVVRGGDHDLAVTHADEVAAQIAQHLA
ncbi:MAG TPA: alpha/beta fold hydrolase [Polyangiales bacterium]|nr:alpha/beta fold hydrolase [Polyangiales bacterium]